MKLTRNTYDNVSSAMNHIGSAKTCVALAGIDAEPETLVLLDKAHQALRQIQSELASIITPPNEAKN